MRTSALLFTQHHEVSVQVQQGPCGCCSATCLIGHFPWFSFSHKFAEITTFVLIFSLLICPNVFQQVCLFLNILLDFGGSIKGLRMWTRCFLPSLKFPGKITQLLPQLPCCVEWLCCLEPRSLLSRPRGLPDWRGATEETLIKATLELCMAVSTWKCLSALSAPLLPAQQCWEVQVRDSQRKELGSVNFLLHAMAKGGQETPGWMAGAGYEATGQPWFKGTLPSSVK